MLKAAVLGIFGALVFSSQASALCTSYPNTLTNGTTADASQVMANFNCAALTAGSTLDGVTHTGTTTFPVSSAFTSTGSMGIGTISPLTLLGVSRNASEETNGLSMENRLVGGYGSAVSFYSFQNFGGNLEKQAGRIQLQGESSWSSGATTNSYMHFDLINNGTLAEKVRITSSGTVGIGTTSPNYTLHVNGSVAGTSAYVNLSDERLKKDVQPIKNALSTIERIQGVTFNWRRPDERSIGQNLKLDPDETQVGFIAQDLEKVLPEAVSVGSDRDKTMSVAESKVVPVLVEALKELKAANDNQRATISDLQTRVSILEQRTRVRTAEK